MLSVTEINSTAGDVTVEQIWGSCRAVLHRTGIAEYGRDAVLAVLPVGIATVAAVAILARTGHLVAAWLTVAVVFLAGVAIARTVAPPRAWWVIRCRGRLSSALRSPAVDQVRWFVHDTTIVLAIMWITCLALLWTLTSTGLLAVASRRMPVNPGGIDREALTAGTTAQILGTLTVWLPAVLILLIASGALHRPADRTEG